MKGKKKASKSSTTEEVKECSQRTLRRRNPTAPNEPKPDTVHKSKKLHKKTLTKSSLLNHTQTAEGEREFSSTPSNQTGTFGRSWPIIEFEKDRNTAVVSKPHIWPAQHDCSKNIFHYITNNSLGRLSCQNKQAIDKTTLSTIEEYDVFTAQQPYHSRITVIDWHPRIHNHFCVGSKHGDFGFYRLTYEDSQSTKLKRIKSFTGIGPGGYISAMKFHPTDNHKFYTASLDGKVCLGDIDKDSELGEKVFLNTCSWERWYCSLDAHRTENYVVAGSNVGHTHLLSRTGESIWEKRLHSQKTSHLEFSPSEPHLLCSASLDHTLRIWDLRMMNEKNPLCCLHHEKGINSAYFSLTDGTRLLTTDQGDNLRVYRAPFWQLETDIRHPHRFFQHITPIKAQWHPFTDTIMCGRFPDERNYSNLGDKRAIDFFNAGTGEMVSSLKNVHYNNITSLCKFNNTGKILLSAMGYNLLLWSSNEVSEDYCAKGVKMPGTSRGNSSEKRKGSKADAKGDKSKNKKMSQIKLIVKDKRKNKETEIENGGKKRRHN